MQRDHGHGNSRITNGLTLVVLPPEGRRGGVAVVALSCADCSTELSGVSHVPRRPTDDVNHFRARRRLCAALAMVGAHTLWAGALVLRRR